MKIVHLAYQAIKKKNYTLHRTVHLIETIEYSEENTTLRNQLVTDCQELGIILENKVVQKIEVIKNKSEIFR